MTSRADIVELALEVLGKVTNGQVEAEDAALVEKRVPYALYELNDRNVFSFEDSDDIPDATTIPFSEFLAAICAPAFNVEQVRGLTIDQLRMQAEQRLRRLRQTESEDFVARRDYF
jgi:hypothetical protein